MSSAVPLRGRLTRLCGSSTFSVIQEASVRTLPIAAVIILGCGVSCSSAAQGVTEGAMVHANSAAATTKMGSALGNTLGNVMGGNAGKMESLSGKVGHVPRASRKISASGKSEQSSGPLLTTSILGTSTPCDAVQPSAHAASTSSGRSHTKGDPSAHAQMAPATASSPQACGIAAVGPSPSKSVVNLSFPK
jgi:hypothetical protein